MTGGLSARHGGCRRNHAVNVSLANTGTRRSRAIPPMALTQSRRIGVLVAKFTTPGIIAAMLAHRSIRPNARAHQLAVLLAAIADAQARQRYPTYVARIFGTPEMRDNLRRVESASEANFLILTLRIDYLPRTHLRCWVRDRFKLAERTHPV